MDMAQDDKEQEKEETSPQSGALLNTSNKATLPENSPLNRRKELAPLNNRSDDESEESSKEEVEEEPSSKKEELPKEELTEKEPPQDDVEQPEEQTDKEEEKQKKSLAQRGQEAIEGVKKFVNTMRKIIMFLMANPWALVVIGAILLIVFVLFIVIINYSEDDNNSSSGGRGLGGYSYYDPGECTTVNVINAQEDEWNRAYDIEEYIAAVVAGEIANFQNDATYEALAIAARTYYLVRTKNYGDCQITGGSPDQSFRPDLVTEQITEAVKRTEGLVMTRNGSTFLSQYDAFYCIDEDDKYFIIKQQNQKIEKEWMINNSWYKTCVEAGHGEGMSQWGSYYLASEVAGYDTGFAILQYYYGNDIVLYSIFKGSEFNFDFDITPNASVVMNLKGTTLSELLSSKGSSIEEFNQDLFNLVHEYGVGTREGVVIAALYLAAGLPQNYDNYNLPYYWGGGHGYDNMEPKYPVGAHGDWGKKTTLRKSAGGNPYEYLGLDCSGFISWAIRNGGYNFNSDVTGGFVNSSKYGTHLSSGSGQPGDLLVYDNNGEGHVEMIVEVDSANSRYIIAHSTGSIGVVIGTHPFSSAGTGNKYSIVDMSSWYANESNKSTSYPQATNKSPAINLPSTGEGTILLIAGHSYPGVCEKLSNECRGQWTYADGTKGYAEEDLTRELVKLIKSELNKKGIRADIFNELMSSDSRWNTSFYIEKNLDLSGKFSSVNWKDKYTHTLEIHFNGSTDHTASGPVVISNTGGNFTSTDIAIRDAVAKVTGKTGNTYGVSTTSYTYFGQKMTYLEVEFYDNKTAIEYYKTKINDVAASIAEALAKS